MKTSEGICLASLALVPRLLPKSRGWPRGASLRVPPSYEVISLADLGSAPATSHAIGLLEVVWDRARLHKRDLGYTSVAVTHGTHCAPSEAQAVVLADTLRPQSFV